MDDVRHPYSEWQYGLVMRPTDGGWAVRYIAIHPAHGKQVWEEWTMPPCDGPFDARGIASELWAAATELLEKHLHLT